ncbi:MAG: hypothetical protein ACPGQL_04385 [Thermoplasmatota archaeon]
MVHWALQSYLRSLGARIDHLPRRIQRQVEAEVLAHVQDEARRLRAEDGELDLEGSIHAALESLGAVEGLVVAIGPVGGLVRSGTQEMVLPVRALSKEGLGRGSRRVAPWVGAAAAGFALALAAVLFFAFAPPPEEGGLQDAAGTAADSEGLIWSTSGSGLEGAHSESASLPSGRLVFAAQGEGCVAIKISNAEGTVLDEPRRCGDWSMPFGAAEGDYQIELLFDGFTGSLSVALE